ncbi:HAD family hydrolase [Arthrobacter mobilis]|uniref:HAD-IA family hydrolase n=1 Tax=Arthrobacter mobilis TaxID=2724944 RepID=A0A7X6HC62_9MICC|nr:HAD-IA family hydrolase [Arthrobacter mobilis]NKX54402.1 HAD-IA family hydrolase [Arthrobacter mobilis]
MADITAVIFDLDGTLVDGSADIADAMNKALMKAGAEPVTTEQVASYLGGGPRILVEKCLGTHRARLSKDAVQEVLEDYSAYYRAKPASKTLLLDTAATAIPKLIDAGVRVGICTNKRTAIAQEVLEAFGLDKFIGAIIGSDLAEAPKPSPRHLLNTVSALQVDPAGTLYVGDTHIDSAAASAAGIAYAHVGWGEDNVPARHRLKTFDDLFSII